MPVGLRPLQKAPLAEAVFPLYALVCHANCCSTTSSSLCRAVVGAISLLMAQLFTPKAPSYNPSSHHGVLVTTYNNHHRLTGTDAGLFAIVSLGGRLYVLYIRLNFFANRPLHIVKRVWNNQIAAPLYLQAELGSPPEGCLAASKERVSSSTPLFNSRLTNVFAI